MEQLNKYVRICSSPHNKIINTKGQLFDKFEKTIEEYYKQFGYRNTFIERLISKGIIDKPFFIYSPWMSKRKSTDMLITEGLYVNKAGHIFYDPDIYKDIPFDSTGLTIGIKPPDILTYAIMTGTTDELIHMF